MDPEQPPSKPLANQALDVIWESMCVIADKIPGLVPLNQHAGLWKFEVDKLWRIEVNPHPVVIDSVPPFEMAVYYNGWPYGLLARYEGQMIHGGAGNIFSFATAMRERARVCPPCRELRNIPLETT